MVNKIKQKFKHILNKITTDFMIEGFYLFLTTIGGMLITQQIIGWILIFVGCFLSVAKIKKTYTKLEEIIFNTAKNISNFTNVNNKLCPFDTRFLITDNKYLDMKFCIENLSNQVINVICDTNKSYFTVDGIKHHNLVVYKNNLYPYTTHSLQIHLMDLEKIPKDREFTVKIYAIFKYGAFGCALNDIVSLQFESVFLLSKGNSNNYELECIKIIQPASPID